MNDLEVSKSSWFLDMDIPSGILLITYFAYYFKVTKDNNILSYFKSIKIYYKLS